jgi:hypothetical protein
LKNITFHFVANKTNLPKHLVHLLSLMSDEMRGFSICLDLCSNIADFNDSDKIKETSEQLQTMREEMVFLDQRMENYLSLLEDYSQFLGEGEESQLSLSLPLSEKNGEENEDI